MKTNMGLVEYAKKALSEKWGYVWGTFGIILTESLLRQKSRQYPVEVGTYESFIRLTWLNNITVDCVGLIKGYLWEKKGEIAYDSNTDMNANMFYAVAREKGNIETMVDIPGVCVWKSGHIGIYIGNNTVIEAHSTRTGVIQTPLKGIGATGWTHWLKCPFIEYIDGVRSVIRFGDKGGQVRALQINLIELGYDVGKYGADGDFGNDTLKAVKKLQSDYKLVIDGIVGEKTFGLLDELLNDTSKPVKLPILKKGNRGEYITMLQNKLKDRGYNIDVDGIFGNDTLAKVREFQSKNELVTDGVVGEKTWNALLSAEKPVIQINDHEAFKKDRYINVVKIRKDRIKKVDIVVAQTKNKLETLGNMYKRQLQKPLVMLNGGLYFIDKSTNVAKSLNLLFTDDITYAIGSYSKKGFLFYPGGGMCFGDFKYTKGVQMIGGSPTIIDNGKIVLDKGNMENSLIVNREPRTAIGMNHEYFYAVVIDGRNASMGWYGMTIAELSNFMLSDLGCESAINLDGGLSSKMLVDGRQYNNMVTDRVIHNSIAIFNN